MRHVPITDAQVAAAWPATLEGLVLAEAPIAEAAAAPALLHTMPTPAVPDVAPGVGGLILTAYLGLLAVFFTLFAGSPAALFAVCVSASFVAIFFTVPRIFLAVEADKSRRPTLDGFMARGIDTFTGHSSGRDALVQILIVPVLLTLGLLVMGIVGAIYI